ncbi:MAG TPA: creatininase family protein, partial [Actinomycetota bacterium]
MLKKLPEKLATGLHGSIPPARYWAYYTWQEIDAIAKRDRNATAVINVGAVEQHGPHLPLITDTLVGMEMLGAALARLPDDVMVLALPPTNFGKSTEHIAFPGTLTFSGETLRMVLRDLAASVARSGFTKLVLLGSHGGNVGTLDDFFRDLRMETDLRVFKIFLGGIGQVPGLVAPEEAAIAMHSGDSETSMVRHLTPELVHMDRAEGYVFDPTPDIGYSFKGHDAIEAWVASDLSKTGAIGNPHRSS